MKKAVLIIIAILLYIVIVATQGLMTPFDEIRERKRYLTRWNEGILQYVNHEKKVPRTLFEVAAEDTHLFFYTRFLKGDGDFTKNYDLLYDPNYFNEFVDYRLYVAGDDWYVVELKPGKLYRHRMIISKKGDIYKLK